MDLGSLSLQPTEGKIAVVFLEDESGQPTKYPAPAVPGESQEACLAIVSGVGPKVTGIKKGDIVVVSEWSRNSPNIGKTHIVDAYCVLAKLKES